MKIVICDPDKESTSRMRSIMARHPIDLQIIDNGKEAQLIVYRGGVDVLILDLDTDKSTGLMVLKYMRINHPQVKIILTVKSEKRIKELNMSTRLLEKSGADAVLIKPYSDETLFLQLAHNRYDSWKFINHSALPPKEESEVSENDLDFNRVMIESCIGSSVTVYDHYIRLGENRFVKILSVGDFFDTARINRYIDERKIRYLYFKTKDRTTYINFMNDLTRKMVRADRINVTSTVAALKSVSEIYIEEVYAGGLRPEILEEGKKICRNMFDLIQNSQDIGKFMREYDIIERGRHGHLFLVSFLSAIICKNMDWATLKTIETVSMAGLLHDIGKLRLSEDLRNTEEHNISEIDTAEYRKHPLLAVEIMSGCDFINDQIKQIIHHHHEMVNGSGYPGGLTNTKIFPLAKIVSLADGFTYFITRNKLTPLQGLKLFLPNKSITVKYDPTAIKALVAGLTK